MANTLRFKRGLVSGIPTAALGEPLFTTDTFDLYIGNGTGNTRFQKYIASGTTSQLLRGDGSLLTMPIVLTSPANGQVLKYDGTNWVNSADAGVTGSGAAGQVTYWGSSSTITGSNNLFWDATNSRLGIGTNAPDNRLQVVTNGTKSTIAIGNQLSGTYPQLLLYGGLNKYNWSVGAQYNVNNAFEITPSTAIDGTTFSTPALTIASTGAATFSGNVGIGITPTQRLHVAGNSLIVGGSTWTTGVVATQFFGDIYGSIKYDYNTTNFTINSYGLFSIATNGTSPTTKFTIFANGNTAIGTPTDAGFKLDVNGTMRVSGASTFGGTMTGTSYLQIGNAYFGKGDQLIIGAASNDAAIVANGNNNVLLGTNGATRLTISGTGAATFSSSVTATSFNGTTNNIFSTGGTERMRLDASGNLGLGVTPSAWRSNERAFQIGTVGSISQVSGAMKMSSNSVYLTGTPTYITSNFATLYSQNIGEHQWYTAPSGTAGANITFTQAMTLTANGNLLINTTTDSGYKLRINGTSYFDDNLRFPNLKGVLFVQTGGTLLGSISMDSSNQVTIDNNGFFGLSVGSNYTMTGGNLGIGHSSFGTSATRTISVLNGTAPSTSPTDAFQMYSNDVTAGNAAPHFRTENGAVIKLYQETTAVGNAIISLGGGNAVLDDTTFDGYTLRQIVRALRNQGILA